MSQKISERTLILLGDITGSEKMPLGVDGDKAITPDLLSQVFGSDFWPLGGAADLSAAVTVDGNNFDLTFGSPNRLNAFYAYADTAFQFEVSDGVDTAAFLVGIGSFGVNVYDDATAVSSSIDMVNGTTELLVDDGTGSSLLSISPTLFHNHIDDGGSSHVHFELDLSTWILLSSDDGVDTSSLSITPTGFNLTDDANGYSITSSATRFRILATGVSNSVVDLEDDVVRLSSEGQINLDASILTVGQINVPTITSNQNNYAPDKGISYRLTSDASRNITGWQPRGISPIIFCINAGSFDIVFTHDDTGNSTAANCFLVPGGGSLTLSAGQAAIWIYDSTSTRWRLFSYTG